MCRWERRGTGRLRVRGRIEVVDGGGMEERGTRRRCRRGCLGWNRKDAAGRKGLAGGIIGRFERVWSMIRWIKGISQL